MKNAYSVTASAELEQGFTMHSLDRKKENKLAFQDEVGWVQEPRKPLLCLPVGMTTELGGTLLKQIVPGLLSLPVQLAVLGRGSSAYAKFFNELLERYSHRICIVSDDESSITRMFAASDLALFTSNPEIHDELHLLMQFGVVPIAPECSLLTNYNPVQESGTAFAYEKENKWQSFASVVRAIETYRFPYDFKTIQKQVMESGLKA